MLNRRNFTLALGSGMAMAGRARGQSVSASGYFVPDEADPHERTFMQWPVNREVHPDKAFLRLLQISIAEIANTVAEFEPVVMLMDTQYKDDARDMLGTNVEIWDIPTDDLWCRDSGPLFAVDGVGGLSVVSLNFNGWGDKQTHENDGEIAERVAKRLDLPFFRADVVGEPGGVEQDGEGTLLAHESSWVNANRNDGTRDEIEAALLDAYGARTMIWAPGVAGEDITDYHIDSLARFAGPGRVVVQLPPVRDRSDPFAVAAYDTTAILRGAQDAAGRNLELIALPEPETVRSKQEDFVASYANFYVCNGGVVAAEFGDPFTDEEAKSTLADLYPDREVVTLNIDPVGEVGGGIHCATQQQPKV